MSTLGDRLREIARDIRTTRGVTQEGRGMALAYGGAAGVADEHEAAALAESAQGRGPHAAAVLRWAAEQFATCGYFYAKVPDQIRALADEVDEAER